MIKKIRDFIYDFSDIFIIILVVGLAATLIFWRVQIIMGYSKPVSDVNPESKIDIDFSGIDLNIDDPEKDDENKDKTDTEDPDKNDDENKEDENKFDPSKIVVDETFTSYKDINVYIPAGCDYSKAIRLIAEKYDEMPESEYVKLYQLLWDKGIALGADYCIMPGSFFIPTGTNMEGMIRAISNL